MPIMRKTASTCVPSSACLSAKAICSSVNLLFLATFFCRCRAFIMPGFTVTRRFERIGLGHAGLHANSVMGRVLRVTNYWQRAFAKELVELVTGPHRAGPSGAVLGVALHRRWPVARRQDLTGLPPGSLRPGRDGRNPRWQVVREGLNGGMLASTADSQIRIRIEHVENTATSLLQL
jgi:hypothetical protein